MIRLMNAGFAHEGEWPYDTFDELLKALSEKAHYEASNSNFQATIDDLNCLIMWRPFPDNYMLRGQMHLALYQWDQAIGDLDMAISRKPDYAPFYFQRGIIYYSILQTGIETRPAALADFEQYLTLDPTGPYAEQAQDHIDTIQEAIGLLQQ